MSRRTVCAKLEYNLSFFGRSRNLRLLSTARTFAIIVFVNFFNGYFTTILTRNSVIIIIFLLCCCPIVSKSLALGLATYRAGLRIITSSN